MKENPDGETIWKKIKIKERKYKDRKREGQMEKQDRHIKTNIPRKIVIKHGTEPIRTIRAKNGDRISDFMPQDTRYIYQG